MLHAPSSPESPIIACHPPLSRHVDQERLIHSFRREILGGSQQKFHDTSELLVLD